LWLNVALAGPVVLEQPVDPFVRCVEEANLAAGLSAGAASTGGMLDEGAKRVALVVGVPCHRSQTIPSLAYSTRDASLMAEMLETNGFTVLRLTSEVDAHQLLQTLDEVEQVMAPDGILLVYFSGHGVLRQHEGQLRRYLVFSDTVLPQVEDTALSVLALQDKMSQISTANRVLVQDTCFAGTPDEGGKSIQMPSSPSGRTKGFALQEPDRIAAPGDQRLFASRFFEQALESVAHQGSVYTHHFLAATSDPGRADLDGDGCIGTLEAHTYATLETATERDGFQNPQIQAADSVNIPLTCAGEATRGVLYDSANVREVQALEPGRQRVVVRDPTDGVRFRGTLNVDAGEWVDVDDLIAARDPYLIAQADAGLSTVGSPLTPTMGGSGWYAGRDDGLGRLALGGSLHWVSSATAREACGRFRGTRGQARAGWWWTAGRLTAGPTASLGLTSRTAYDACDPGQSFDTHVALGGGAGVHTHLSLGQFVIAIDALGLALAEEKRDQRRLVWTPSLTTGLGIRF